MKLDDNYRLTIRSMMDYRGWNADELGAKVGVSGRAVNSWLSGETVNVRASHWSKLRPLLESFLPHYADFLRAGQGVRPPSPASPEPTYRQPEASDFASGNLRPVMAGELTRVPVISMARASGYAPSLQNTREFFDEMEGDYEYWDNVPDGHMLIRVDGNSMFPILSNGSVIQVNFNLPPKSGEMVAALISDEEYPVIKYYHRKNGIVYLQSVNPDRDEGRSYKINVKDRSGTQIGWIHPVVQIQTKPMRADELDWSHIEDEKQSEPFPPDSVTDQLKDW